MANLQIPILKTGNHVIDNAFSIACGDFTSNIFLYKGKGGLLDREVPVIRAGMDYDLPWTRDTSFNVWYAGSLLAPQTAKNTLLSVLSNRQGEPEIDEAVGQYWDIIIWAWGAWNYYLCTGDREFLKIALPAIEKTLAQMREDEFDSADGLYRGGACFQDGIAAYPDQFVSNARGSGIMSCLEDEPRHEFLVPRGHGIPCKALSTNCLYLMGYQSAIKMRAELGLPEEAAHQHNADALRDAINAHFWNDQSGCYRYLLDANDTCERQEGLGAAFAILSGAADREKCAQLVANTHITPNGLPAVWPPYERYMGLRPNGYPRHSGTVWPQVNAAWVSALCDNGYHENALHELELLAKNATRDSMFSEIYHPDTGLPYGGLQENGDAISSNENGHTGMIEWKSCVRQTWAATGYIHMALKTLFGLHITPDALTITPYLPMGCKSMHLSGLRWRNATLDITVNAGGNHTSFTLPASAEGIQEIKI